jgi:hypothetical protein
MKLFITIFALTLITLSSTVIAGDKAKKDIVKETPITKWMKAENTLLDNLPRSNKEVFFIFRNKHSVIRSIEIIRDDIGGAVKACGKANPEIKKEIRTRFKDWKNAVLPILKEARKFLKKELKEQEAFHTDDYHYVMKLNDKAYNFSEGQITKIPVTSKKACEGLLKSMDSTEDKLVGLLQSILLPEEVVRERLEQAKKAEEKYKN